MMIYDQTSIAFAQRCEDILRQTLNELGFEVKRNRFVYKSHLYPITVVVFEGTELGHFNSGYYQIAVNRRLIYSAKDSVVRDILKHELAHYLTFIKFGQVQAHGPEFREVCRLFNFPDEIAFASMNLNVANESKQGDLESERVIEKVKKLLQLAQSSNAHEAELATIKANALLLRHNLDHIKNGSEETIYLERVLIQKRKDSRIAAIYEILRHFIVRPVISMGKGTCCLEVSGTLTNVKLAVYVAEFLSAEFDRLWKEAQKEHGLQGLRAKNSFFLGIAKGYDMKMKVSKATFTQEDQKALVVVEKNLEAQTKLIYRRLTSSHSGHRSDAHAGAVGYSKGRELTIRKGVESSAKGLYLGQ